jgi:hypothetical protein
MSQGNVKTIPLFRAHSDKTNDRRRRYGAVTQHQLGERRLLTFTLEIVDELPLRIIVAGWLLGRPQERPGLAALAEVNLVSMRDRLEVTDFVQGLYPDRAVKFWES